LTNLILNELVYPEFVQHIKVKDVVKKVSEVLDNFDKIKNKLEKLDEILGFENATDYIAKDIFESLNEKTSK
jgi:lipid A disaccharide synthetase